ncbi:ammonium transporter [Pseudomonas sp. PDM14]|uniref:ammonium transporter n=1 Tax=Pseudomonas sp. PDM14 TaxID=2769288 RepID=UPI0017875B7F|nr:ammonium transporter [Pseudomonas sp. PDM14]MBD9481436.1 ammonium transporter [Pseudomonas sp. PDM14]
MNRFLPVGRSLLGASVLLGSVAAQAEEAVVPTINSGDTAFVVVCALVVLLMTLPGLALFYGGMARSKNVLSVLTQVFVTTALMSVLFAVYGYSLTFADGGSLQAIIGGTEKLFLGGVSPDSVVGTIPEYLYFLFMLLFAAITPAIIVGAFAERMKFAAVLVFMAVWLTINYIPMAHMAWGGGWVFDLGVQDFAGGNVVHLNVGIAALVGAWLIGKRRGYGTSALAPHNMTMTFTGGSLLWVGWLGFCGGCALAASGFAMLVIVNTMLASCAGALAWLLVEWLHRGKPSLFGAISGAISGLVIITPACGFVGPMGAILLGFIAAPVCVWAVEKLKPMLGLDDAFDVFGVHGVAGILGGLLTPVFALTSLGGQGFVEGRGLGEQLLVNGGALLFSIVFSAVSSWIAYKIASLLCGGLRVEEEVEVDGLDLSAHGEVGYKYSN